MRFGIYSFGLEFNFAFGCRDREKERKIFQLLCECVGDYEFYTLELPQGNKQSRTTLTQACVIFLI